MMDKSVKLVKNGSSQVLILSVLNKATFILLSTETRLTRGPRDSCSRLRSYRAESHSGTDTAHSDSLKKGGGDLE
jgi:hypothetical protein